MLQMLTSMLKMQETTVCPSCGRVNVPVWRFCDACGKPRPKPQSRMFPLHLNNNLGLALELGLLSLMILSIWILTGFWIH